jgi:hemoglobin
MSEEPSSIFQRIGGETAVMAAVALFYDKVLADDQLAPFFAGLDMPALISKQVAFMTMAFGGPHQYTGRDLKTAHAASVARGLNDEHFDRVAGCLKASLEELSVDAVLIQEVLALVETTRDPVLGR